MNKPFSLRHLPFYEALARHQDDCPAWRVESAGYLVLRLFDEWLAAGGIAEMLYGVQILRIKITELALDTQTHELLDAVLRRMEAANVNEPNFVAPALLAYGIHLEQEAGKTPLAVDVFQTLAEAMDRGTLRTKTNTSMCASVYMWHGYSTMRAGNFVVARRSQTRAILLAKRARDLSLELRARVWNAALTRTIGNLSMAEHELDTIIADAQHYGLTSAGVRARMERGAVRYHRGRVAEAILDYFAAYDMSNDADARAAALVDLGACAAKAGYFTLARKAHQIVLATSSNWQVRNTALVSLLELAALEGDQQAFAAAHASLTGIALSAELTLYANLARASMVARFGTYEVAVAAYQCVVSESAAAGMNHIAVQATEQLTMLQSSVPLSSTVPMSRPMPEELEDLARTVDDLHTLAMTGCD
jgi:tetratricopeptide (TPR) repeat protein